MLNKISKFLAFNYRKKLEDIYSLQMLSPLVDNYIPWSNSSIRPSAVTTILNEIAINGRKEIVEFGSGISTLYIAKLLKEQGGRLNSFEHDGNWAHIMNELVKQNDLDQYVSINFAPLSNSKFSLNNCKWYDENIVYSKIVTPIDFIIVDGPPAYLNSLSLSRYPAIPCLHRKLSDDYCIILDDINRSGEEIIVSMWEKELGIQFSRSYAKGGIAIGRSKSAFNI